MNGNLNRLFFENVLKLCIEQGYKKDQIKFFKYFAD